MWLSYESWRRCWWLVITLERWFTWYSQWGWQNSAQIHVILHLKWLLISSCSGGINFTVCYFCCLEVEQERDRQYQQQQQPAPPRFPPRMPPRQAYPGQPMPGGPRPPMMMGPRGPMPAPGVRGPMPTAPPQGPPGSRPFVSVQKSSFFSCMSSYTSEALFCYIFHLIYNLEKKILYLLVFQLLNNKGRYILYNMWCNIILQLKPVRMCFFLKSQLYSSTFVHNIIIITMIICCLFCMLHC